MKILRKIIEIDPDRCDGCGQCVPSCAEGAIQIIDGKARLAAEKYCDGLGACLGECPNDALQIIEREAEDFDEAAVEEHLKETGKKKGLREPFCPAAVPPPSCRVFPRPIPVRRPISRRPRQDRLQPLVTGRSRSNWFPPRPHF